MNTFGRVYASLTCCFTVVVLSACASAPQNKNQQPVSRPAPISFTQRPQTQSPPQPIAPVSLTLPMRSTDVRMNEALVRSASAHAGLIQIINATLQSRAQTSQDLNSIMESLAVVFSPLLGSNLNGYGALVAAQNNQFVDSLLDAAQRDSLDTVINRLYADPDYAANFEGASLAAQDVSAAWSHDIAAIRASAGSIKQHTYEMQKDPAWTKKKADSRKERIATLKAATRIRAAVPTATSRDIAAAGAISSRDTSGPTRKAIFWRAYGKTVVPSGGSPSMSPRIKKALTLGALESLGATGEQSSAWIRNYTTTPLLNQCTNWARLHVEQCLAAGHYKYEDAYCIAEHQLSDTADCLKKSGY